MVFHIFYDPASSDATMKFETSRRYIAKYGGATCGREKKKRGTVLFLPILETTRSLFMKIAVKLADWNTKVFFTRSSGSAGVKKKKGKKKKREKEDSIKSNKNIGHARPMHLYRASAVKMEWNSSWKTWKRTYVIRSSMLSPWFVDQLKLTPEAGIVQGKFGLHTYTTKSLNHPIAREEQRRRQTRVTVHFSTWHPVRCLPRETRATAIVARS